MEWKRRESLGEELAEWQQRVPRGKFEPAFKKAGWDKDRVYNCLKAYKNQEVPKNEQHKGVKSHPDDT